MVFQHDQDFECSRCHKNFGTEKSRRIHITTCEEPPSKKSKQAPTLVKDRKSMVCRFCRRNFVDEKMFFRHREQCREKKKPDQSSLPKMKSVLAENHQENQYEFWLGVV
jgi:hypothetical protein